ncbi:hypothetical protein EVAR_79695_1 [Eumeta japonica]|uniref:Uncharacterized protein n=1 Tax=Eumeta variegata TaxID=151549 RepID=A0A4C1TA21_EUMVA|nr:hypothetical protein EVAR_79695_1 [Eumeta japonica]
MQDRHVTNVPDHARVSAGIDKGFPGGMPTHVRGSVDCLRLRPSAARRSATAAAGRPPPTAAPLTTVTDDFDSVHDNWSRWSE